MSTSLILALSAALFFGVSAIPAKRGLSHADPQAGALISIAAVVATFSLTSPWWMQSTDWFIPGFWWFVATGLVNPMLSIYFTLESMNRAGVTVASTLAATSPLFAAFTAILFLGETMTTLIMVGTLVTMAGVMSLTWTPGTGVTRVMRVALIFATAASIIRGLVNTTGKIGLDLLPNAMMAGFLSYTVGGLGVLLIYRIRHGRLPLHVPRAGVSAFALSGVCIAVAITCMYAALLRDAVTLVSPVIATYPVFTLLAALALREERITLQVGAGVAVVVGGVVLINLQ
ncbi:MAG: DMT family transporter [Arenicellales bacterium]|nr:DMT family transporter [Arenicellales bacterium]